jgi:hypothetical protein
MGHCIVRGKLDSDMTYFLQNRIEVSNSLIALSAFCFYDFLIYQTQVRQRFSLNQIIPLLKYFILWVEAISGSRFPTYYFRLVMGGYLRFMNLEFLNVVVAFRKSSQV